MSRLNRRNFLKAGSSVFALPYMASLTNSHAASKTPQAKRLLCLGLGYGVTQETWYPDTKETGTNYTLPQGLEPLARHKKDFTIFQNFAHQYTSHAHWGSTMYLTGANRYGKPGSNFHNTISMDQIAAAEWGKNTRFTSMHLSTREADGHGHGLSMAWNKNGKPLAAYSDPLKFYNALFSTQNVSIAEKKQMIAEKRSSMDLFLSDLKSINRIVNQADKDKLNEYLKSVREIELRLSKEEKWMHRPKPKAPFQKPQKIIKGHEEIKLMYDLITAAFQIDSTRVMTYRLPVQSLLQSLGTEVAAHDMSHYTPGPRQDASQMRDTKNSELLAYLLDKLKAIKDNHGEPLLNNTTVIYGSNIRATHFLNNCPTLVAGNTNNLIQG